MPYSEKSLEKYLTCSELFSIATTLLEQAAPVYKKVCEIGNGRGSLFYAVPQQ